MSNHITARPIEDRGGWTGPFGLAVLSVTALLLVLVLLLLASARSEYGVFSWERHQVAEYAPARGLPPAAVEEATWTWQAPDGPGNVSLRAVPGGVAVLHGEGVAVLAAGSGEPVWQYRLHNETVLGDVSNDGRHVVLHIDDEEAESTARMLVLESGTGVIRRDFSADRSTATVGGGDVGDNVRQSLQAVTGQAWFTADHESVVRARELGTGDLLWTEEPAECGGLRGVSVDQVLAWDEGVVVAYTCVPSTSEDDGAEDADSDDGLVSGLVGLDPSDGAEVWREEVRADLAPDDSWMREFTVLDGGLVLVGHPISRSGHILDPFTGELLRTTECGDVPVWADPEGELFGIWQADRESYRIEDRDGEEVSSTRGRFTPGPITHPDPPIGLREGVVHVDEDRTPDMLTQFEGFDGERSVAVPENTPAPESGLEAVVAEGAVAVAYTAADGERHVAGLQ